MILKYCAFSGKDGLFLVLLQEIMDLMKEEVKNIYQ